MNATSQSSPAHTGSRLLGVLAVLSTSVAAIYLLLPNPLADAFFAGWVLVSVILSLVGGIAAWKQWTPLVWVVALLMTALSIMGVWSIGLFIAPAALFLFGAAILSYRARPREGVRKTANGESPTVSTTRRKIGGGIGALAIGSWLIYVGAFAQELFGACATEGLECTINRMNWAGVGMTVLGVTMVGFGGLLLWKHLPSIRVFVAQQNG
ncbi:hypothetical protein [Haladaptatus halobius]|uniref:hypothetical protein n=1 Tax=Haladaptatus halobius TaxID=2884875 RepID=UPI001D0B000D|nr:hypothetical protein [Haladaptatus halobius]